MRTYINFIIGAQESVTLSLDKIQSIKRSADLIYFYFEQAGIDGGEIIVEADAGKGLQVHNNLIKLILNFRNTIPCVISAGNDSFVREIFSVTFNEITIVEGSESSSSTTQTNKGGGS